MVLVMKDRYQEIRERCPPDLTCEELAEICREWRDQGERIVFTNGCFDVLHEGHLELFAAAIERCDRLVIAVNSDDWVARHKGSGRPLQPAGIRRAVAHCMAQADLSIVFEDETAERLLAVVKPAIYILGSDYRDVKILGSEHCGEVVIMERLPGFSTTELIARAGTSRTVRQHLERTAGIQT
jgi:D-beta-D-heptose 7-phosphate kinase/D-beta-D-heptose 1-phosphate adenosyltransferase